MPAAARMPASGVRRSCDTESTSALLSAASRRATSAASACCRSRSRPTASATWAGGQGEQAGLGAGRLGAIGGRVRPQAPDGLAVGLEADLVAALAGRWAPVAARLADVHADPRGLAAIGHQGLDHGRRAAGGAIARVGDDALGAAVVDDDPHAIHARIGDEAAGDGRQRDVRRVRPPACG